MTFLRVFFSNCNNFLAFDSNNCCPECPSLATISAISPSVNFSAGKNLELAVSKVPLFRFQIAPPFPILPYFTSSFDQSFCLSDLVIVKLVFFCLILFTVSQLLSPKHREDNFSCLTFKMSISDVMCSSSAVHRARAPFPFASIGFFHFQLHRGQCLQSTGEVISIFAGRRR